MALVAALALMSMVVCAHSGLGWQGTIARAETVLTWLALAATLAACGILLWDERARFVAAALHAAGFLTLALILVDIRLSPDRFWWVAAWTLAGYVLLTSALRAMAPALLDLGRA